ncbi:MAG: NUDIX hydrolase [Bilifractor sp.]|nr:NUDIX hydrolase [Bilifractor sp.]
MKDEDQNPENRISESRVPGNRSQSNRSLENQISESRVPENQRGTGHLRRLSRSLAYSGSVVDVYQDTMELPDGCIQKWDFVCHKKGGGACIVPVLADGRILMVRQYRPAIDRETLELPAGAVDAEDATTEDTARRELREETGYTAGKWKLLLRLKTAVAYCNEYTDVYLASELKDFHGQALDEAEEIRLRAVEPEVLLQDIYSGRIQDSKTVAGILAYTNQKR